MASIKIQLMGTTVEGYDFNLEIVPGEGEKAFDLFDTACKALKARNAVARPSKFPVKGLGGSKAVPEKCPECGAAVVVKGWTNPEGKAFKIYECGKDKAHFKPVFKIAG